MLIKFQSYTSKVTSNIIINTNITISNATTIIKTTAANTTTDHQQWKLLMSYTQRDLHIYLCAYPVPQYNQSPNYKDSNLIDLNGGENFFVCIVPKIMMSYVKV